MALGEQIDLTPGPRLVPFERRHLGSLRRIAAVSPAMNIHLAATLRRVRARQPHPDLWTLLVEDGIAGAIQRGRGISWILDRGAGQHPGVLIALADFVTGQPAHQEIVFGPEHEVEGLIESCRWQGLEPMEIRRQEMMICPAPLPAEQFPVPDGFRVRPASRADLRFLLKAHAAMCREDLGIDQVARNPEGYQRYFTDLVRHCRCLVIEYAGRLVGKADIPLASDEALLIEGVFSDPAVRGRGLVTRMMAEIAYGALGEGKAACLYVHRRNSRAAAVYRRVGFQTVCPWVTAILGPPRGKRKPPVEW